RVVARPILWAGADTGGNEAQGPGDAVRRHDESVIGLRAGQRRRALDGIEPAHLVLDLGWPPPRRECARIAKVTGRGAQEVALDGEDHIGLRDIEHRVDGTAEGELRRGASGIAMEWLPLLPVQLGKRLL